jgi:hypothetical protein
MKKLLLQAIVCVSALLPLSQVQAKTFGDFAPNKKFVLTVTEKISAQNKNGVLKTSVPVPAGLPNFSVGQKVKFKIGNKGELIVQGFSIGYKTGTAFSNGYGPKKVNAQTRTLPAAVVFKDSTTFEPTNAALYFFKVKVAGTKSTVNTVTYILEL